MHFVLWFSVLSVADPKASQETAYEWVEYFN
jgi:hypothetical protein